MDTYIPDNWVIVRVKGDKAHYRVLAGWSGGYLSGNSWRINSGIVRHEREGDYYYFYGESGSCYKCYIHSQMLRMNVSGAWETIKGYYLDQVDLILDPVWEGDEEWVWDLTKET